MVQDQDACQNEFKYLYIKTYIIFLKKNIYYFDYWKLNIKFVALYYIKWTIISYANIALYLRMYIF